MTQITNCQGNAVDQPTSSLLSLFFTTNFYSPSRVSHCETASLPSPSNLKNVYEITDVARRSIKNRGKIWLLLEAWSKWRCGRMHLKHCARLWSCCNANSPTANVDHSNVGEESRQTESRNRLSFSSHKVQKKQTKKTCQAAFLLA